VSVLWAYFTNLVQAHSIVMFLTYFLLPESVLKVPS
jgi:hypothetical protein